MEEQKLIYSGKLLKDTAILKDILRTYEGQENHTVHLVCNTKMSFQKSSKSQSNYSANSSSVYNDNTPSNYRIFASRVRVHAPLDVTRIFLFCRQR